jgi:hypothetical protein
MPEHEVGLEEILARFDQGAPIPSIDAAAIKQLTEAVSRMASDGQLNPNAAMGLGAYAAYGFDASSLTPEQFMAVSRRQTLLAALVQRGVLSEYMQDEKSRERVYLAAATIPCNRDDVAEAFILLQLCQIPSEQAEPMKQGMKQQGYDPDEPRIDGKFVAWMTDNC